jgi:hypothetical protein
MAQPSYSSISDFILFSGTFIQGGTIIPGPRYFFDETDDGIVFTRAQTFGSTAYFNINPSVTVSGPGLSIDNNGRLSGRIESMVFASENRGEVGRLSQLSINAADFTEILLDRIAGDRFSGDAFNRFLGENIRDLVLSDADDALSMRGLVDYLTRVDLGGGDDVFRAGRPDTSDLTVEGGTGFDVLRLDDFNRDDPFIVDLSAGTVLANDHSFRFSGFEEIQGNAFVQRYIGSAGDDIIRAAGRADGLSGAGGNDDLDGGFGEDTLKGDQGDDTLTGGAGNDTLDGGEGTDTAVFEAPQSAFTLTLSPDQITITDRRADGLGTDELRSIEFLDFEPEIELFNGPMNFDIVSGPTGLNADEFNAIIELYIAYFNRAPDAIGLNYWATDFTNGFTLPEMALSFFVQDETRATYASVLDENFALDLSDRSKVGDFITEVYGNVLGRAPDTPGFNYWVDELENNPDISPAIFILAILNGAKYPSEPTELTAIDQIYLANKVELGAYFSVIKGMSDVDDAASAMALFTGSQDSIDETVAAIDGHYADALNAETGDFLMPLVGVIDDPFAVS